MEEVKEDKLIGDGMWRHSAWSTSSGKEELTAPGFIDILVTLSVVVIRSFVLFTLL